MSHYRPKKHNEYKIGIVSKKEYKDLVPHKEYADKTFGFANPKEKTAIIIDTGNDKLNQQHLDHELEELIISKSPHEVDGIRYGWLSKAWDKVVDTISNVGEEVGDWVEGTFLPEGVKATINDIPLVGDAISRGWLGSGVQQLTDEGKEASMFSPTSKTLDQIYAALTLAAVAAMGAGSMMGTGAGGGTAIGSTGASAGGNASLWAPLTSQGALGSTAASSTPWWVTATGAGGTGAGLGTATAQGGSMASILDWINPGNNLLTGGQPYNTGLDLASWLVNPSSISNTAPSIWSAGLPSTSWQQMGTAGLDIANLLGLGNLTTSGGGGTNTLWNLGKNILNQILGGGGGQQLPGGGQQMPTGTNTGGFNLSGLLNSLIGGGGGGGNSALGTIGPAAMLAYLNQKRFDYPSPSAIEWPTWMEQVRQGAMNPQEYDIASQKFQNLMGTDPTNAIMTGLQAQQDIDRQNYEKYINPIMASQGQYDSTYRANMLGDYLRNQQAQALTQRGQLAQWVPEFQSTLAGSLANLGSQRSASGQGWFGQGLGYTGLQNTPTQRGFELEYAKQAKAEEAKNQAEQLWSAILMGNMFPQNPVFNPRWGTGQTGGFNLGNLRF